LTFRFGSSFTRDGQSPNDFSEVAYLFLHLLITNVLISLRVCYRLIFVTDRGMRKRTEVNK